VRSYVGLSAGRNPRRPARAPRRQLADHPAAPGRGALDGIFAFSTAPLRFAAVLGVAVAGTSALLELFFLYFKLFTDVPVQG